MFGCTRSSLQHLRSSVFVATWASLLAQLVKNPPTIISQETWVRSLVGKIPWRREWLPTLVFWFGEFYGLYSPWGHKESDTTEWLSLVTGGIFSCSMWCLVSWSGIKPWSPALGARNLRHWTTRKSPVHHFLSAHFVMHCARLLGNTDEVNIISFLPELPVWEWGRHRQKNVTYHMVEERQVLESDHLAQKWGGEERFPGEVLISGGSSKISKSKGEKQLPFCRRGYVGTDQGLRSPRQV